MGPLGQSCRAAAARNRVADASSGSIKGSQRSCAAFPGRMAVLPGPEAFDAKASAGARSAAEEPSVRPGSTSDDRRRWLAGVGVGRGGEAYAAPGWRFLQRFGQVQAGRCGAWTGGEWQDTFLLSQAAEALFKLGRWDQAHRLPARAQATPDDRYLFLTVAELEIGRDEFQAADARGS